MSDQRETIVVPIASSPAELVTPAALGRPSCAGMVVVDHVAPPIPRCPRAGELVAGGPTGSQHRRRGGQHRGGPDPAGRRSAICARVGDDIFGRFATETLVAHGVDVAALEGRSCPPHQPDPDRQRSRRGSAVHPLAGCECRFRPRRPRCGPRPAPGCCTSATS